MKTSSYVVCQRLSLASYLEPRGGFPDAKFAKRGG